jgi:hypothetical protein
MSAVYHAVEMTDFRLRDNRHMAEQRHPAELDSLELVELVMTLEEADKDHLGGDFDDDATASFVRNRGPRKQESGGAMATPEDPAN